MRQRPKHMDLAKTTPNKNDIFTVKTIGVGVLSCRFAFGHIARSMMFSLGRRDVTTGRAADGRQRRSGAHPLGRLRRENTPRAHATDWLFHRQRLRHRDLNPTSTLICRYYFAYHAVAFLEIPRGYYRFFGRRIGGMNVITSEGPRIVRKGAV